MTANTDKSATQYHSTMTRRESLKWLGLLSTSVAMPLVAGCNLTAGSTKAVKGHWPEIQLSPITVNGYGKDPMLIIPPKSPWPKTLTKSELTLVARLSDIIMPRVGDVPSASEVNVPDVIDEWVSAPYQRQQSDRPVIHAILQWVDDESTQRFGNTFVDISPSQQLAIIDDIAYTNKSIAKQFERPSQAFDKLRQLVLAAFYCSPVGTKDLGYLGNTPIAGDYPGPSKEAKAHLISALEDLGLTEFADLNL